MLDYTHDKTSGYVRIKLFPSSEAKAGHETGWLSCLNKLEGMFA